jgi:2-polyprenyl-3-methyl-5-hydroxy-6-metoxy-1,4-benzoquinol methylase
MPVQTEAVIGHGMAKFDAVAYWLEEGQRYEREFPHNETHQLQEQALQQLLLTLPGRSVLDVGCGFGRIGEIIARVRPDMIYTGLDLSPEQLAAARRRLPDAEFIQSTLEDFETTRRWDVVLAIEVLLHVPPNRVMHAISRLRRWAELYVVTLDWDTPIPGKRAVENWCHDYVALMPDATRTQINLTGLYVEKQR